MGGLFKSPPPPPPPRPAPPPPEPSESEADIAAKAARDRRCRAQAGTIATAWRDLNEIARPGAAASGAPKRLLGE